MNLQLAALVLSVFSQSGTASASVTSAHGAQTSFPLGSTNATCPYRTINYITHCLPQQCLTSSWRSTSSALSLNATDSLSAVETSSAGQDVVPRSDHVLNNHATLSTTTKSESTANPEAQVVTASTQSQSTDHLSASTPILPSNEPEESSPLEDDKFMSFEEWKKQNLQKAGQSEHVGRGQAEPQAQRKRPVDIHTALDSLGDDAEIDLDFSGFIPGGPELVSAPASAESHISGQVRPDLDAAGTPAVRSRSPDAGTTCKERFNYASFDCAANILKTNSEATSAGAVLGENKDNYMLNVCSANNKFLILELCDDISIDTIVLANFEFFSSIFRTFRVSVSDKYPVKLDKWKTIGTFEARNTRDVQAFLIENSIIWARYVRIEFLTHYGNEYYCPVSLVRVHGTTMLEEYKRDAESLLSGEDDESDIVDSEINAEEILVPEAVAESILEEKQEQLRKQSEQEFSLSSQEHLATNSTTDQSVSNQPTTTLTPTETDDRPGTSVFPVLEDSLFSSPPSAETCSTTAAMISDNNSMNLGSEAIYASNTTTTLSMQTNSSTSMANSTNESKTTANIDPSATPKQSASELDPSSRSLVSSGSKTISNATATDRLKSTSSSTQSHAAAPTMQESFFKSVQKRLQMLEANSSLSLQYIEDQSRALRDAFNKVEQRQLAKTTTFLDYLNTTVLSELRDFRQQYDQLWQSTVIELQMQRERYQQENVVINARLGVLADELIFQKRISILQMVLILICLALVLFAKGNTLNQYLEMPVVQRVLARSPSNRWLNLTNLDTPTHSPSVTRQSSLRKGHGILKGHKRMASEDSIEGSLSPNDVYPSPPTPTSMSYGEQSDLEHLNEDKPPPLEDPEFDPGTIKRPSTSPPILPSEMPSSPDLTGVRASESIDTRVEIGLSSPPMSPDVHRNPLVPRLVVEEATPDRHPKHLTWKLPDS